MRNLKLKNIEGHDKDIEELRAAIKKTKNVRMHKRYSVLLRHFEGFTNKKIAEMEGLEPHAVGNYIKKYIENGLEGLEMKHSPGAKRKLTTEQEEKIVEIEGVIKIAKLLPLGTVVINDLEKNEKVLIIGRLIKKLLSPDR